MKIERINIDEADVLLDEEFVISWEQKSNFEKELKEVINKYRI